VVLSEIIKIGADRAFTSMELIRRFSDGRCNLPSQFFMQVENKPPCIHAPVVQHFAWWSVLRLFDFPLKQIGEVRPFLHRKPLCGIAKALNNRPRVAVLCPPNSINAVEVGHRLSRRQLHDVIRCRLHRALKPSGP
jgi:hypothetical protein